AHRSQHPCCDPSSCTRRAGALESGRSAGFSGQSPATVIAMPAEMKEMAQARALLKKFEDQMHKPEGLVHLAEALSLLADVRDSGESDEATKIASNIVIAYAQKVNGVIEGLARERIVHIEIVEHWREVMREFEG